MAKYFPFLLIVIGLILGVYGFNRLGESEASMAIGDVEISASDEGAQTQAYILIGLGAVGVIAGVGMMARSKS